MATPTDDSYTIAAGVRAVRMGRGVAESDTAAIRYGALLGQSNMENPFGVRLQYPLGAANARAYKANALRRIGNINDSLPPGSTYPGGYSSYTDADPLVQGDALVYFANDLAAAAAQQIVLFPHAVGGSTIASWLTGAANWAAYAADVVASGVLPRWAVWLQGESNATADAAANATYAGNLAAVQAQLVSQSGRTAAAYGFGLVPLGPAVPGPNSNVAWTPEGNMGPLRAMHVAHAATATGAYLINAGLDASLNGTDPIHWNLASYVRAARRYAEWVRRWAAGDGGALAGPRITGASRSGAQITLTIAHAGGAALLDGAGGAGAALAGFRVFDSGAPVAINSTAILSPTSLRLTLAAAPSGAVTMDFGMANLPFGATAPAASSILYDNTTVSNDTVGIPLQPKAAFAVT